MKSCAAKKCEPHELRLTNIDVALQDASTPEVRRRQHIRTFGPCLGPCRGAVFNPCSPQVNWEDQQRINKFGRLNSRLHEIQAELKAKRARPASPLFGSLRRGAKVTHLGWALKNTQKLLEDLDEAGNEILVTDDTEVRYGVGECFVSMENDDASRRLDKGELLR